MLKSLLKRLVPLHYRPYTYLIDLAMSRCNCKVQAGPFRNMNYVEDSQGSCLIPKLLGTYERELHAVIGEICSRKIDLLIDIGAAEGYYAVGMATRLPQLRVAAFEMTQHGRDLLLRMCQLNSVTNQVEIRGKCELADLQSELTISSSPVLIVDCEGYEKVLLDPQALPDLLRCCVLVETHEMYAPGIIDLLKSRFGQTHRIDEIHSVNNTSDRYPFKSLYASVIPLKYKAMAVSEARWMPQSWLWMQPRAG